MAYETPEDQPDTAPKLVEAWLEAIECAEKEELD
jgi:ABC-type nitrate/sulfonate/bicarbonate transport system substrate-binding protein